MKPFRGGVVCLIRAMSNTRRSAAVQGWRSRLLRSEALCWTGVGCCILGDKTLYVGCVWSQWWDAKGVSLWTLCGLSWAFLLWQITPRAPRPAPNQASTQGSHRLGSASERSTPVSRVHSFPLAANCWQIDKRRCANWGRTGSDVAAPNSVPDPTRPSVGVGPTDAETKMLNLAAGEWRKNRFNELRKKLSISSRHLLGIDECWEGNTISVDS